MKIHSLAFLIVSLFAALAIAGCGSSSDSAAKTLAGRWSGPFTATGVTGPTSGQVDVVVLSNGRTTGTLDRATPSALRGILLGAVSNDRDFSGTLQYPANDALAVKGSFTVRADGHMVGSMDFYGRPNQVTDTATIDLQKVP